MPLSSKLAPGFIRLTYSGLFLPHHQIIPINFADPPTPGVNPSLMPSGGTPVDFVTAIDNYVDTALNLQFNETTKFGLADIYKVDPTTGIRTFIYTTGLGRLGEAVPVNVANAQAVWVFKSTVGKPVKVTLMESIWTIGSRNVGTVPADARQDMINYIVSPDNIFYGRTNAYPLAFSTFTTKENDVLRERNGFSDV